MATPGDVKIVIEKVNRDNIDIAVWILFLRALIRNQIIP